MIIIVKPSMLYYLHIEWNWIKQRPHYLAQELGKLGLDVSVMYVKAYRRKNLTSVDSGNVRLCPIFRLPPFGYRFPLLNAINEQLVRHRVHRLLRKQTPEYLWLTYPLQILDIPEWYKGKIIYDCMDDHEGLSWNPAEQKKLAALERKLCHRADVVLVSSEGLREKLLCAAPDVASKLHVVFNGCEGSLYPRVPTVKRDVLHIGYVGTIAQWFDFPLLEQCAAQLPWADFTLIGPVDYEKPPVSPQIHMVGTVSHDALWNQVRELDCLIMPFRMSDAIRMVDPVKLYEYISWQKPIVAVDYPEIQRFSDYICTYTDTNDFCQKLEAIHRDCTPKYSEEMARYLLEHSSWKLRGQQIWNLIGEKEK